MIIAFIAFLCLVLGYSIGDLIRKKGACKNCPAREALQFEPPSEEDFFEYNYNKLR